MNKFLQPVTKPNLAPLTYDEARQWYQVLGNLSADEASKLPPSVKRDLAGLVTNLKTDIGNAAGDVGRAADYYKAMGDFAKASRLQDAWATYKPWLIKTGIYATGAGVGVKAGYSLYKLLTGE